MTTLLMVTDGRDECLRATISSAVQNLPWNDFDRRVLVDDSGSPDHPEQIAAFTDANGIEIIYPLPGEKRGFGGAIQTGWDEVNDADFIFHLEDDFVFNRPVPLDDMIRVLRTHEYLVQIALRRQAWNPEERAAGGIVEQRPHEYQEQSWLGFHWLEHRLFLTTNPSVYRGELARMPWPSGPNSEGRFSIGLMADAPNGRFAFWGPRNDDPWVTHIGEQRTGVGY